MGELSVSIVISTLNRGPSLADTLSSLKGLHYSNFEVIVVNGPSTDKTEEVLKGWGTGVKHLRCAEANLSMSRNIGIGAAAGEIVAFIDDDAVPHPRWLEELSAPYHDARVGGAGGFTIDNTGVRYQARKTICDRFGNAHYVSPFFDERPLCFPGAPFYPSLLGTNSSFRRSALEAIGGFDNVFAYFLDETDVCLRLIDAGYRVQYVPEALVFHQFAESHLRNQQRIPKTLYPSAVSKSYFIFRHGSRESVEEAMRQLETYRKEILKANEWLCDHNEISGAHRVSLDRDVTSGISAGRLEGIQRGSKSKGDLSSAKDPRTFLRFEINKGLRIVFVSQSFPPTNDAGIARWTSMMARGFAERGYNVHVLAKASEHPSIRFAGGYWLHLIATEPKQGEYLTWELDLPENIADWAEAVRQEVRSLRTFGVDVVSFPIWDVEGVGIIDDPELGVVMSLHTTYAIAKEFKPEWQARPLYEHFFVNRVIRQERRLLEDAPVILANSEAIVADLTNAYDIDFSARSVVAPHGTYDPFKENPGRLALRKKHEDGVLVGYVGRFEPRKGIDIALKAIAKLLRASPNVKAIFAGDNGVAKLRELVTDEDTEILFDNPRVTFSGLVSRHELDDIYAACHVVTVPSRYESFGLVAIEAMAAGAVVVALATGGLKEIVRDGSTGFLVPPGDYAADLVAERLIGLSKNATLWGSMSAASRADFENRFTIETMVEKAEAAYLKALAMKGQRNVSDSGARDIRISSTGVQGSVESRSFKNG